MKKDLDIKSKTLKNIPENKSEFSIKLLQLEKEKSDLKEQLEQIKLNSSDKNKTEDLEEQSNNVKLESRVENSDKINKHLKKENEKLSIELERYKKSESDGGLEFISQLTNEKDLLDEKVNKLSGNIKKLNKQIKSLKENNDQQLKNKEHEKNKEIHQLNLKGQNQKTNIIELEKELLKTKRTLDRTIEEKTNEIEKLNQSVDSVRTLADAKTKSINSLSQSVEQASSKLEKERNEKDLLQKELKEIKLNLNDLKGNKDFNINKIKSQDKEINELKSNVQNSERDIKRLKIAFKKKKIELETDLMSKEKKIKDLEEKLKS